MSLGRNSSYLYTLYSAVPGIPGTLWKKVPFFGSCKRPFAGESAVGGGGLPETFICVAAFLFDV